MKFLKTPIFNDAKFQGQTSGDSVTLKANATTGAYTLTLPSADGSANQALVTNGSGQLSFATQLGYTGLLGVYGFISRAIGNYTGSMDVICPRLAGFGNISSYCIDRTQAVLMTFDGTTGTGYSTISLATDGIKGVANRTGDGTATSNSGSATVTGSGTSFLTQFGTAALTGVCSSSGTTVTGTSEAFMREISVGDMIGNAANGYSTVTAIASNSSLTINTAIPGGALSGASVNRIEGATIRVGSKKGAQVSYITSDTSLTVTHTEAVTMTNSSYTIGVVPTAGCSYPTASYIPLYLWVGKGGSGTDVFLSTQRTVPLTGSAIGYNSYHRRVGSVFVYVLTPWIMPFSQSEIGNCRDYTFEVALLTGNTRILANGAAASTWTKVDLSPVIPPTATAIRGQLFQSGVAGSLGGIRYSGGGDSGTTYPHSRGWTYSTVAGVSKEVYGSIGDTLAFDYFTNNASATITFDLSGYKENI